MKAKPVLPDSNMSPKVGTKIPDGTIYAGISPDTGRPMYTTPSDAPLTHTFNAAKKYASKLDAHGHQDWRVPTEGELNLLFNNRAAIGGFNVAGTYQDGWYWSSSQYDRYNAEVERFSDGTPGYYDKADLASLRLVR